MTSTTSNYGISYPNVTDFVKDGANAIETVAERVDAALFAQVANRNLLYNGAMQVAQRSTSAVTGITSNGYYTVDRWNLLISSLGTWTQTPDTDVPTGQGFRRSLKMSCTTADASPAAGDYCIIQQRLEGQDVQALRKGTASAQQVTLSFWVKSYQTGTFIIQIVDEDNTRSVSKPYTVNASATWEYKTISFPADTTGVLDNDNASSLVVRWWLGAGSTFTSGTLNQTWAGSVSANMAVGQINAASSTSNYWAITGAQLTIGATAMPFQFKSYQQELCECQRYFSSPYDQAQKPGTATSVAGNIFLFGASDAYGNIGGNFIYPVEMRASPTITFYRQDGSSSQWDWNRQGISGSATPTANYTSRKQFFIVVHVVNGLLAGVYAYGMLTADAEL